MQINVHLTETISPELARMVAACRNTAPVLDAMGQELVGIAKRSFNDPSLRVASWPQKKRPNGQPLLKLTGNLWHSLRVVQSDAKSVTVGSDRPYAAIHQLGGRINRPEMRAAPGKAFFWPGAAHPVKKVKATTIQMPARPFFPFDASGDLAPFAARKLESVARAKLQALFRR